MKNRFPELPDQLGPAMLEMEKHFRNSHKEEFRSLALELKQLKSEALQRSLDWRRVGKTYAEHCELCEGSGHYHFCLNPYCRPDDPLDKEDCVHFTPDELDRLEIIHRKYLAGINKVWEHAMGNREVPNADLN